MTDGAQSDELSLEALRSGDRAEFARLVDQFSGPIYRLGLKITDHTQDAEDVLQETFLKAYRALSGFEGRSSLATWLYRIAVNEALMLVRRRQPDSVSLEADVEGEDGQQEPMQIVDFCCLPESELLTAEARQFLDNAIQNLPDSLKVVFLLRDIEGLSIRDTMEALDLSETAVKTRLLRARLNLREQLSSYYGERLKEEQA